MASLALHVRPMVASALVLTALSVVPWRDHHVRQVEVPETARSIIQIDRYAAIDGDIIPTPWHPDARPWPHGMVIRPPAIDRDINLWSSPLDNILSALLSPLLALSF